MNTNLLGKALKKLAVLILLFIASPVLLTMAFKAIKNMKKELNIGYPSCFLQVQVF